ncbi:Sulfotransferase 1A1, partial [Caligus rogercresseyi]
YGLEIRQLKNVLFITYEDMKKDIKTEMRRVLEFMEWPELSQKKLDALADHLSFSSCK